MNRLRDDAVEAGGFHTSPLAKLLPFYEQMGVWLNSRKEFWWEREWRRRGDLDLAPYWDRIIWLCPEAERDRFQELVHQNSPSGSGKRPICIDPSWGLEQLVGRLCEFDPEDLSLFHASARQTDSASLTDALQARAAAASVPAA